MKDADGKELSIGDKIVTVFDGYKDLVICKIVKFTRMKVGVIRVGKAAPYTELVMKDETIRYRSPSEVAKIE